MNARKYKNRKTSITITIAILIVIVMLAAALIRLITENKNVINDVPGNNMASETGNKSSAEEREYISLNKTLVIKEADNYTGIYMEDGTDEPVTGILKIEVTNVSGEPVQYAEINLDVKGETAHFTVTALPAGATAVLLERNRMEYRDDIDYMSAEAECVNMAMFNSELSLHEDKLKIQTLDGALNITNISGEDITDTIILCYKSYQNDMYYGGIAYRIKLEGGLKAGELRQIMAEHFQEPGSQMVFVDFVAA